MRYLRGVASTKSETSFLILESGVSDERTTETMQ